MKRKILILFFCLLTTLSIGQAKHYLTFYSPGAYFFNYAGYRFNKPYAQNPLSISYTVNKGKKGFELDICFFAFGWYKYPENVYPRLYRRSGVFFNFSYLKEIISYRKFELNYLLGLSTKLTSDDITIYVYNSPIWAEGVTDKRASNELGGIGINAGFNAKQILTKRLYLSGGVKTVNFLIGARYQTHTIFTEIGLGLKFGKLK